MQHLSNRLIPGYYWGLAITLTGILLIIIIPFCALISTGLHVSPAAFWQQATNSRVLASYSVSLRGALVTAIINSLLGLLIAWTITCYQFPGKRLLIHLIDLPFAMPTSVAGIALAYLYSNKGFIGRLIAPIKISYTFNGIVLAMVFVTLPFVVREVQPVLEKLDPATQEAALTLGATTGTIFRRVIFPEILPALLAGFSLVFARCLGEYGSIIFIAGNQPFKTEITPLIIMFKLETHDYQGATVIALIMLAFSFGFIFCTHSLQLWLKKRR